MFLSGFALCTATSVISSSSGTRVTSSPTGQPTTSPTTVQGSVPGTVPTLTPTPIPSTTQQYTPDQAQWDSFQSKPLAVSSITAHDPNNVGWISNWPTWDGTIYDPSVLTRAELSAAICPSPDTIRGIREVFYQHNPFADNAHPTKAEVDEWHRIAINHVRALVGYTSADRQVSKDHCMFARALWGQQRKFSTMWDSKYPPSTPGVYGTATGPCINAQGESSSNSHCGANFVPDATDQAAYLPAGHAACTTGPGSEGIFSSPKSNIPWSIKWSRSVCGTLGSEGFWGGHTGPFFHREKFGFSFWDPDPAINSNNAPMRNKWTGNLMPSLYTEH